MLEHALALAALGFRVFPCWPGTKVPAFPKAEAGAPSVWQGFATTDRLSLAEKWAENPSFNPAIFTRGYLIVDVDTYKGFPIEVFTSLGPVPKTFTVRTARGGTHFYFRTDEAFSNSAGTLPKGIDIRGHGGLVLGPGATFEGGTYDIVDATAPAPLPQWLANMLRTVVKAAAPTSTLGNVDSAEAVERAKAYLAQQAPAIEGEGGDSHTYKVCARLRRDFNLSIETALEVLEPWNDRCVPPWDIEDLEKKLENAGQYGQNLAGTDSPLVGFAPIEAPPKMKSALAASFMPYNRAEADDGKIEPIDWIAERRLIRRMVTVLVAPGGSGKSLFTLQMDAALALGPDENGETFCGLKPRKRYKVATINDEDPSAIMENRLGAICRRFKLPRDQIRDRIFLQSSKDKGSVGFCVLRKDAKGRIVETEHVADIVEFLRENEIDVLTVDPAISAHELDENNNGEARRVVATFARIANEANVAVLLVAHTKKPSGASSESYAGNADAIRGASAIKDTARIALTLFRMTEKDGERFGIKAHERHRYLRLDDAKANLFLITPDAEWFRLESVDMPNGDSCGVMVPVQLVDAAESEAVSILSSLALKCDVGERLTVQQMALRLLDCPDFNSRNETWAREHITAACCVRHPIAGGKTFVWKRDGSKTGGHIIVGGLENK